MRILHVIQRYYPYVGGSELYFQELSERLARAGHRVEVWTTDAWDLDYFWSKKARRIETPHETHNGVVIRRFRVRPLLLVAMLVQLAAMAGFVVGRPGRRVFDPSYFWATSLLNHRRIVSGVTMPTMPARRRRQRTLPFAARRRRWLSVRRIRRGPCAARSTRFSSSK